jgi:hypothetical protein
VDQYIFTLSVPSWHVEGQLSISHINDRQQTIVLEMWSLPITRIDAADVEGTGFDTLVYRLQSMQLIGQEQKEIVLFMCQLQKNRL